MEYDLLAQNPQKTIDLIYQFIGEEDFQHDFKNVEYDKSEFDLNLNTKGLHKVHSQVEFKPRQSVIPLK